MLTDLPQSEKPVTFIMSIRIRRKDDYVVYGVYDSFEMAKKMVDETVSHLGHYEGILFNSKGVQVYSTRQPK